jgi:hypothetical protein
MKHALKLLGFLLILIAILGLAATPAFCAEFTVTVASVLQSEAASLEDGIAGEAITIGAAVYKDASDSNQIKLAQCDGTAAQAAVVGIAVTNAAAEGQPVKYARLDSSFTPGFSVNSSVGVWLGQTAGKLCLETDLASTNYGVFVGVGIGTNKIRLAPAVGGAKP